jgi:hypothetical protein
MTKFSFSKVWGNKKYWLVFGYNFDNYGLKPWQALLACVLTRQSQSFSQWCIAQLLEKMGNQ